MPNEGTKRLKSQGSVSSVFGTLIARDISLSVGVGEHRERRMNVSTIRVNRNCADISKDPVDARNRI